MNPRQLHITNGDSTANLLTASAIEGDVLAWRDPMHHGPFPAKLSLEELGDVRAEYLAGQVQDFNEIKRSFQRRNEYLRTASQYQVVVLWFEHDLLDQLQLLELLSWFSQESLDSTALFIICINHFPGIPQFRGLGQLSCKNMESLVATKVPVTQAQLTLGRSAWAGFRSSDPKDLEKIVNTDLSVLPFLKVALLRHLQEYPWKSDGLTRTERQILKLVSMGEHNPSALFVKNMNLENALYIGDWHTYHCMSRLNQLPAPLINCEPDAQFRYPPLTNISTVAFKKQRLHITAVGSKVLAHELQAHTIMQRDEWLGGVHLDSSKALWVWDAAASELVLNESI